ncbi:MAG: hypothetical protein ABI672_15590 [Vicinamibacteria bacterium]
MEVVASFLVTIFFVVAAWSVGGLKLELLLPLIITTGVATTGWHMADLYSKRRDRANKQRDLRVQYLIEAYRRIETLCGREDPAAVPVEAIRGFESAITDVQLFGSSGQIDLARRIAAEIETASSTDPRHLLADLRADLRRELQLEPRPTDPKDILHFRVRKVLPRPESDETPK